MAADLTSQITNELTGIAPDAQQRVLEYVRSLKTTPKGTPGAGLVRFAGSIDSADAQMMISRELGGAGVGCWTWDIGQDQISWSTEVGDLYGLPPADYPTTVNQLKKIMPPSASNDLEQLAARSMSKGDRCFESKHQIFHRDGSRRWVHNLGCISFTETGDQKRLVAITIDISEQMQEEEKRLKNEKTLLRYSSLVADFVYSADLTMEPIVATEVMGSYKNLVGYTVEELEAKGGWMGIAHPDDRQAMMACLEALKNGSPTTMDYRITNADGEVRWIHDHSFPQLKDGVLVSVEGCSKDITEQRALAEQLVEAQKTEALAQLASSVAHDFNNLLYVIVASVELISDPLDKDPEVSQSLSDINEACDRAVEVTRSLLAFSRKDKPEAKTVRLSQVFTDTYGIVRRSVGERIALRLCLEPALDDRVDIDVGHLQLVLLNIAANARAAMPEGGELVIRTRKATAKDDLPELNSQEVIVLELADNGCGIHTADIQNVFNPFFTTKSADKGTGLGLAICRQIIENAGGTIRIQSSVGDGTVLSIYLPTTTSPVSAAAISSSNLVIGGNERILLVEDDEVVRRLTTKTLERLGYRVVSVDSIANACNKFDDDIDVLIADVRLPDGDGSTLASDLRRLRPQLPVLLVSGYVGDKARARIDAEGYSVLPKPYSTSQLARSVRVAIKYHQ